MIKASEAKRLVKPSNLPLAESYSEKVLERIDSLVKLACDRGLNKTTYQAKYDLLELKNVLTQKDVSVKVLAALHNHGYEVEVNETEYNIKW